MYKLKSADDFFIEIENKMNVKGGYDRDKLEGMIIARDVAIIEKCKEAIVKAEAHSKKMQLASADAISALDSVLAEIEEK
jgi:hypothetical protein